jgi:hypothetical protein
MILLNYIPETSITIGRFLPNFTLYMPAATSKLDMINYPLLVTGESTSYTIKNVAGTADSTISLSVPGYAMWRQSGLQTSTKVENFAKWEFNVGLFNGPTNNKSDNNDAKDVLLRVGMDPNADFGKILVGGYAWLGNVLLGEDADLAYNKFGFFGMLDREDVKVKAEYVMGSYEQPGDADDLKSTGYYGHVEYRINSQFGILGRYDFLDPNTDVDDNAFTWITFGVNHYIESYNAMIYLNYVAKMEQNDWCATEKIKNDIVMLQFQVAP